MNFAVDQGGLPKTASTVISNAPMNSSLLRLGNGVQQLNTRVQNGFNSFGSTIKNGVSNFGTSFANAAAPITAPITNVMAPIMAPITAPISNAVNSMILPNMKTANSVKNIKNIKNLLLNENGASNSMDVSAWALPLGIFVALVIIFATVILVFKNDIKAGYANIVNAIRASMGSPAAPPQVPVPTPSVPTPPPSPAMPPAAPSNTVQSIVEKILPASSPEVFSVNKNDFGYYDAEPLCKALGAELATYDQVKSAYERGADWCNYGWVKGQMAVYPTQKETYDMIQKGPDEERGACGRPGLNGGYFDNPDMKFGVTCYGVKPNQSGHDEEQLMKNGRIPKTAPALQIDQKVRIFQEQADSLGVLPFNQNKWSSE